MPPRSRRGRGRLRAVVPATSRTPYTGDSRVVLVRSNQSLPLTIDHSPTRTDERVRCAVCGLGRAALQIRQQPCLPWSKLHLSRCPEPSPCFITTASDRFPSSGHSPSPSPPPSPTPTAPKDRIRRAGGQVVWQNGFRVMGALSMTRAIGDHFLRPAGVIADPEISAVRRSASDEFLLLATVSSYLGVARAPRVLECVYVRPHDGVRIHPQPAAP